MKKPLITLSFFGNRVKEFVVGQKINYIQQRRNNVKPFVIKAINYKRARKITQVQLVQKG